MLLTGLTIPTGLHFILCAAATDSSKYQILSALLPWLNPPQAGCAGGQPTRYALDMPFLALGPVSCLRFTPKLHGDTSVPWLSVPLPESSYTLSWLIPTLVHFHTRLGRSYLLLHGAVHITSSKSTSSSNI